MGSAAGFEAAYHGRPPWEIGRPQAAFVGAVEQIRGRVLDSGCGTGELALMAAARGLDASGIDASPTAIAIARKRCAERGLTARFVVGDVLRLDEFTTPPYDTVLDSGLLHVFDAADRPAVRRPARHRTGARRRSTWPWCSAIVSPARGVRTG